MGAGYYGVFLIGCVGVSTALLNKLMSDRSRAGSDQEKNNNIFRLPSHLIWIQPIMQTVISWKLITLMLGSSRTFGSN